MWNSQCIDEVIMMSLRRKEYIQIIVFFEEKKFGCCG